MAVGVVGGSVLTGRMSCLPDRDRQALCREHGRGCKARPEPACRKPGDAGVARVPLLQRMTGLSWLTCIPGLS
jgi:hypothetical protein